MEWLIVLIVVVVLAALGALALTQSRSASLKRKFGPEYDRLLAEEGDRRAVQARLRERQKRRDALDIRELPPEACEAYSEQWRETQLHFVDDPAMALAEAGGLVEQVARQRGYPIDDGEEGIEMVSVDHPRLIGHYRTARTIHGRTVDDTVPLDDIRSAFRSYRALFNELLGDHTPRRRLASPSATAAGGEDAR